MTSQIDRTLNGLWNEREKVMFNQNLSQAKSMKRLKLPKKSQDCKKAGNDMKIEDVFLNSEYFKHQANMSSLSFCSGDNGKNRWTVDSKFEIPFRRKVFKTGTCPNDIMKNDTASVAEKEKPSKHCPPKVKKHDCNDKETPQVETEQFLEEIFSGREKIDRDLITLITEQMFLAERELQITRTHLIETISKLNERDLEIIQLHEKIQNLQKNKKIDNPKTDDTSNTGIAESVSKSSEDYQRLITASEKLKKQVKDMEEFLNDYGLVWVGNKDAVQKPDLDKIIQNFQKLNTVASQPKITETSMGAKFEIPREMRIILYSNGLLLGDNDFREYNKISTSLFLQDIEDGYFPSELQAEFPDGVPFEVVDKRTEVYNPNGKIPVFQGHGNRLGSTFEGKPSTVVYLQPVKQSRVHDSPSVFSQEYFDKSPLKKLHKKRSRNVTFQDENRNYLSLHMNRMSQKFEDYEHKQEVVNGSDKQLKIKIRFGFSNRGTKAFVLEVDENKKMLEFQNSLQRKLCENFHDECVLESESSCRSMDFELHIYGKHPFRLSDHLNEYPGDCGIVDNCVINVTEI